MAAAQADNTQYVQDERVAGLADSFGQFLSDFSPENWMPEPSQGTQGSQDGGAAPRSFMARRVEEMCQSGETVLYIEFDHLQEYSYDMSHQIRDHYERAEPVLRRALQDHVRRRHADYLKEAHGVEKEFFIGVTGLPDTERLRDLRVEKIGRLVSFSGTVTRTTEVRPELFLGAFKCGKCSTRVTGVEQQYKYTTPMICKGKACGNRNLWVLDRDESVFVDWQRVKVQENVDEIPGGALPRTMDVILRANNVDRAKAGDRVSFAGSLVVCPDVAALFSPGQGVSIKPAATSNDATGEGVVGVGAGNREVTYRLMFIACSAQDS
ncbi:DNA replication licensing factor mcm6 [Monoraphidium neglectum]|uniref:DNA replication licensing factor MCM6 n=1 Tax=Monoraphidium neglectum TaxID=145388 RepID=A0A0D2M182_9CHLO|nr:DNA replication licensing factor mcm6 [Monoraphidium neglectum]KIY95216.1 DNA replication licensing factor mcm6 [Monoraphidium neglectum]|eukprot:XP_013894236.1 DNA replication licensing factor mcm6 [Monoraphidium neglectum]